MRTLVVVDDVSEMVTTIIVSFSDAHRVVSQVDIAVIACDQLVNCSDELLEMFVIASQLYTYKRLLRC